LAISAGKALGHVAANTGTGAQDQADRFVHDGVLYWVELLL
jgi:hypothetical protein